MLVSGVLVLLGALMICPVFVPSRWRRTGGDDGGAPTPKTRFPAGPRRPACSLRTEGRAGRARRLPASASARAAPCRAQCAPANCSLSVEPPSAVVDASGVMADVTRSK